MTGTPNDRPRRWVVSVESLHVPARAAILKTLQTGLGLTVVADGDQRASSGGASARDAFALLLHRMRALARLPPGQHVLWVGPWLLNLPRDPTVQGLHARLAAELMDKLLPEHATAATVHLMLCMRTCTDEAFEQLLEAPGSRGVSLKGLRECQDAIHGAQEKDDGCPFPLQIVRLDCPRFAADNPVTLDRLARRALDLCRAAMGREAT